LTVGLPFRLDSSFDICQNGLLATPVLIQVIEEEEKVIIGSRLLPRQMQAQWFAGNLRIKIVSSCFNRSSMISCLI